MAYGLKACSCHPLTQTTRPKAKLLSPLKIMQTSWSKNSIKIMETMFQLVNKYIYLRAKQAQNFYTGKKWFTTEENDSTPPPPPPPHCPLTTGPCKRHAVASGKVVPSFLPSKWDHEGCRIDYLDGLGHFIFGLGATGKIPLGGANHYHPRKTRVKGPLNV